MKLKLFIFLALLMPTHLLAQAGGATSIRTTSAAPTSCTVGSGEVVIYSGVFYVCGPAGIYVPNAPLYVSSAPSGSCTEGTTPQLVISTGVLYTCQAGTWTSSIGDFSNPVSSIAIQYVSPQGNDANSGLSWALSKLTIYNAICSLPGGNCSTQIAGSGTIYVAPGSAENSTSTCGIWIMGAADPNFSSPPACWLKSSGTQNVHIIGITDGAGAPNPHRPRTPVTGGSSADNNHPAVWIAASAGYPLEFDNLAFGATGRGIVIGECSNNLRNNTCNTTQLDFENDSAFVGDSNTTGGPCTDLAGWNYWIWFRDFGCSGNATHNANGYLSNSAASILLDGTLGHGNGLIYFSDINIDDGGIKIIPGDDGGYVSIINVFEEGCCGNAPPPVWWTNWNTGTEGYVQNVSYADIPNSPAVVENDATNTVHGAPLVINPGGAISGPAYVIQPYASSGTISPLREQQYGVNGNYLVGESDAGRRLSTLVPVRFTPLGYSNPANWATVSGSVAIATNVADPFGGTGAATLTASSTGVVQMSGLNTKTSVPGDWAIFGMWIKGAGPFFPTIGCPGEGGFLYSATYGNTGTSNDGQWQYVWQAGKVSSGGNACLSIEVVSGTPVTVYGPTEYYVTNGTFSDNEALEFASNQQSVDFSCPVGSICNVTGHPLNVDDITLRSGISANTNESSLFLGNSLSFASLLGSAGGSNLQVLSETTSSLSTAVAISGGASSKGASGIGVWGVEGVTTDDPNDTTGTGNTYSSFHAEMSLTRATGSIATMQGLEVISPTNENTGGSPGAETPTNLFGVHIADMLDKGTNTAALQIDSQTTGGLAINVAGGNSVFPSISITPVAVASLPSASANAYMWRTVSDSTTISAEGQTCVGSGSVKAAAFSNGSAWKCF